MKLFLEIFLLVIIAALSIFLLIHLVGVLFPTNNHQPSGLGSVCFKNSCFEAELAKTDAQRELGLMNRTELDKNKGMLFVFDSEGIYPFWMKNTLIPLDIVWINGGKQVVYIAQNVQPCKGLVCMPVLPKAKASYVLEVNAGTVQDIGLKTGDQMFITIK